AGPGGRRSDGSHREAAGRVTEVSSASTDGGICDRGECWPNITYVRAGVWAGAALLAIAMALALGAGAATAAEPVGSGLRAPSATEARSFWSPTLGRSMPYFVYLPPGYSSGSDRRYPVLYM